MLILGDDMREVVNILIVEDDDVDVEFLRRQLDKKDIRNPVYRAANGVEALEIMRGENQHKKVPRPYVVLLDINMPLMNGIELLKEMRSDENLKDNVVFMLTTSPRNEDKIMAYQLNVAGYFLKKDMRELVGLLNLYWQLNEFPEN